LNSEHNRTLIKFREVEHNFKGSTAITPEYYFIYPAIDYKENFKHLTDVNKNEKYLSKIDEDNVDLMFKEILKYNEELRLLWQRGEMFAAPILKTRYQKTKVFYKILCKFILEITTMFYYSNLWMVGNGSGFNAEQICVKGYGPESKGMEFSFDKAFGFAMQLEKTIKAEFNKILDILYPSITEKAIVSAVLGKGEAEQEIGKELNKGKTKKKHKSKKHHKKHRKAEPEAEVKAI